MFLPRSHRRIPTYVCQGLECVDSNNKFVAGLDEADVRDKGNDKYSRMVGQ